MGKVLSIKTKMEKEDYRKFLYYVTFFKGFKSIGVLIVVAFIASLLLTFDGNGFEIIKFLGYLILMLAVGLISIVLKIEKLNRARIKTDKVLFDYTNELYFYDEYIQVKNKAFESDSKIPYNIINKVLETKDFYLIYLNNNQASVIRKKDIYKEQETLLRSLLKDKVKDKVSLRNN